MQSNDHEQMRYPADNTITNSVLLATGRNSLVLFLFVFVFLETTNVNQ